MTKDNIKVLKEDGQARHQAIWEKQQAQALWNTQQFMRLN